MVMILGLARTSFSSAPAERMFVSCFLRHGFTYRSSDLDDSPMTIPAYTFFSKKKRRSPMSVSGQTGRGEQRTLRGGVDK
jgi:hypothetical protein